MSRRDYEMYDDDQENPARVRRWPRSAVFSVWGVLILTPVVLAVAAIIMVL